MKPNRVENHVGAKAQPSIHGGPRLMKWSQKNLRLRTMLIWVAFLGVMVGSAELLYRAWSPVRRASE
jgi:hypothetical protein